MIVFSTHIMNIDWSKKRRLTEKWIRANSKENDCNTSQKALKLRTNYIIPRSDEMKVWDLAVRSAQQNGRKTVMDRDVEGLFELYNYQTNKKIESDRQIDILVDKISTKTFTKLGNSFKSLININPSQKQMKDIVRISFKIMFDDLNKKNNKESKKMKLKLKFPWYRLSKNLQCEIFKYISDKEIYYLCSKLFDTNYYMQLKINTVFNKEQQKNGFHDDDNDVMKQFFLLYVGYKEYYYWKEGFGTHQAVPLPDSTRYHYTFNNWHKRSPFENQYDCKKYLKKYEKTYSLNYEYFIKMLNENEHEYINKFPIGTFIVNKPRYFMKGKFFSPAVIIKRNQKQIVFLKDLTNSDLEQIKPLQNFYKHFNLGSGYLFK